jgi:(R,R)-butanediol dehydrogenase / meso-butanediol dehydrogenase / diacetyl reductase
VRAIRWHARGDVRLEEVPAPGDPGPDEVRLAVILCGICGTDLEEYRHGPITIAAGEPHPLTGQAAPIVLGHEVLARVIAIGEAVTGLRLGDRVVPDAAWTCGECVSCRGGRRPLCTHLANMGLHRDGGMAEQVRLPASMCIPVPDGVPDEVAVLTEPLAVAVRAVRRAGVESGERVLVIGAGTIGQCVLRLVAASGAAVGIVDPDPVRVAIATAGVPSLLAATTAGDHLWAGEADCVIDCAGSESSFVASLAAVRPGGRVMLVGAAPAAPTFSPHDLLSREATITTSLSHDPELDTRAAVRLLATGAVSLAGVVTSVLSLEAAVELVFSADAPALGGLKTVVDPSLAAPGPP